MRYKVLHPLFRPILIYLSVYLCTYLLYVYCLYIFLLFYFSAFIVPSFCLIIIIIKKRKRNSHFYARRFCVDCYLFIVVYYLSMFGFFYIYLNCYMLAPLYIHYTPYTPLSPPALSLSVITHALVVPATHTMCALSFSFFLSFYFSAAQDLLREKQQHVEQLMVERELDREDAQNQALQLQKNINEVIIFTDTMYMPLPYADRSRPFRLRPTSHSSSRTATTTKASSSTTTTARQPLQQQQPTLLQASTRSDRPKKVWFSDKKKLFPVG